MSMMNRILRWPRADYDAWVALGKGGIEHGVPGWITVNALRVVANLGALAPFLPRGSHVSPGLVDLPCRSGARPLIAPHPIPQRQLGDCCSTQTLHALDELIVEQHQLRSPRVNMGVSKYERHVDALYVERARECGLSKTGEIAHVHHPQGSLHVHLAPADARVVYERGWGEPHALAFLGLAVPRTWMFIYFPRDRDELEVVAKIVATALDWACEG